MTSPVFFLYFRRQGNEVLIVIPVRERSKPEYRYEKQIMEPQYFVSLKTTEEVTRG